MNNLLCVFLFILVLSSCQKEKALIIEPFTSQEQHVKNLYSDDIKEFFYLVEGFNYSENQIDSITSFVCSSLDSNFYKYNTFGFGFYKKSKITNNEHIKKNPKDFFRHSTEHDILLQFTFTKSGTRSLGIYKNSQYPKKTVRFECENFKKE